MIVISGALVAVALILLVIGLVAEHLNYVYASIAVSVLSFVFLVVGILQRRKELPPAGTDAPAAPLPAASSADEPSVVTLSKPADAPTTALPTAAPVAAEDGELHGSVLVIDGKQRYHVAECRFVAGKETETVDVADAKAEGFTACGVCKPDAALAAAAPAEPEVEPEEELEDEPEVEVVPPPTRATRAPARKAAPARARVAAAPVEAPVVEAPVVEKPAKKAPAKKIAKAVAVVEEPVVAPPAKKAAKKAAPAKAEAAPAKKAPAKKAAPAKRGVIVIPDRGKYHTPDCRYVRGTEGTVEVTKAVATKQGYEPCGVCNP